MQGGILSHVHVLMLFMLDSLTSKGGRNRIWASHTYGTLKLYNMNITCDVTFWSTMIVCCFARLLSLMKISYHQVWRDSTQLVPIKCLGVKLDSAYMHTLCTSCLFRVLVHCKPAPNVHMSLHLWSRWIISHSDWISLSLWVYVVHVNSFIVVEEALVKINPLHVEVWLHSNWVLLYWYRAFYTISKGIWSNIIV